MRELKPGLWHWQATHPDWSEGEEWPRAVSSYALDDGEHLLLFDPLAVPDEILALASEREPVIVLTAPWHERDAERLVERLGAPVYTEPPDSVEDIARKFKVGPERAGDGSPDVRWLKEGKGEAHWYAPGDTLPFGIEAFGLPGHNDAILWVESARAVVCGDSLADWGDGLRPWGLLLRMGCVTEEELADSLRPVLDKPVELVLPAHGEPAGRAALERALA